ncbi:hypothetical protein ACHAQA_007929 [Verticillium albo-atrum]
MNHDGSPKNSPGSEPPDPYPPTYFGLADHGGVMYAHIALMILAWVIVLPLAVMLSLARSRFTLALQFGFLALNALGGVLGAVYNTATPDLFPNNAHHKVGWLFTWIAVTQVGIGLLGRLAGYLQGPQPTGAQSGGGYRVVSPMSAELMAEHRRFDVPRSPRGYRLSNDSGQGTEPNTDSLGGRSVSGGSEPVSPRSSDEDKECEFDAEIDLEDGPVMPLPSDRSWRPSRILKTAANLIPQRLWRCLVFVYNVLDRLMLLLGFVGLTSGIAAYGRFFEGREIYNGMAHWVKGGVFFWLGVFNLGRWAGSFGELGWAWNVRPRRAGDKWRPSAEFVESALIFFYGSTNIFLEHLGNEGNGWRARDLEHVSITVLFIGGGLLGMLVESTRIRDLLSATVTETDPPSLEDTYDAEEAAKRRQAVNEVPEHYEFSINPIPALVILLLGIMMSSHHQSTMISSMVHKQWGNLLSGASFARGFTYILMYLKPPRSILPSRPPTELLMSFGLIAGGIIFMASSADVVEGMIHYELDAMFMYTVTTGLVGLLMAWIIIVLAVKGAAVRRQGRAAAQSASWGR